MSEQVNHPTHYGGDTTYEVIKVIEAWSKRWRPEAAFHLGNAIKYLGRAGLKAGVSLTEDLHKAVWYLCRLERPYTQQTSIHYDRVQELMEKAGQEVKTFPEIPSLQVRRLRARLLLEEVLETCEGLGLVPFIEEKRMGYDEKQPTHMLLKIDHIEFGDNGKPDLVKIADGCADVSVVNVGTMIACGIRDLDLLTLVDQNNLAKFGPGGYRREDGKWMKPPGHEPPDIAGLLRAQAEAAEMRELRRREDLPHHGHRREGGVAPERLAGGEQDCG